MSAALPDGILVLDEGTTSTRALLLRRGALEEIGAVAQALARALVFGKDHDVAQRSAFLLLQGGSGQGGEHDQTRHTAQCPPIEAAHQGQHHACHDQGGKDGQHRPGHQRVKEDGSGHWPNRSSKAGTWT